MSDPYDWPFPKRKDLMGLSSISKKNKMKIKIQNLNYI